MFLSVLLSSTLIFVSLSIGASYESAQRKMARGMAGTAALSITAADGRIDAGILTDLPSSCFAAGILEGSALYHENGYYETIDLIASPLDQLNQINPPRLADGDPIADFSGSQVILPDRFTSKYGINQGDTVTLTIGGTPVSLEVAGIAAYDTVFLRHTRGATALLPFPTLSAVLGGKEGYSKLLVKPAPGISAEQLKSELSAALSSETFKITPVADEKKIAADARQKSMPFFLISFFALTMSVFIIYSSYKVITLERLPAIGTFRSIGATQKTVTRILLLESLVYGITGGLSGIPAGSLILNLVLKDMGNSLSQGIEIPVVISPFIIIFSITSAIAVSLFSAWFPIYRASRLPVKEVVLGTVEEKQVPRPFLSGCGAALFIAAAILPKAVSKNMLYPAGGFSLLGLITAAVLAVPLLTDLLSIGLEHIYGIIFGNEGRLAARNMRNNKTVQQNITLLFISISAVIAITVTSDFVTSYVGDVFKGAELEGFADGPMEPEFVEQVKRMEGVNKVLPLHVYENQIQAEGAVFSRLEATGSLDWFSSMMALHYTENDKKEEIVAVFDRQRTLLLSESCMERTGFSAGDTLFLSNGVTGNDYLVAGSFKSRADDVEAVISSTFAVSDFNASDYQFLAYTADDPEAVMVQIRSLFGRTPNWSRTVEEFNTDALSVVEAFLQPMHSMTYFILLLAAAGTVNNLLVSYIQKRRTTAMYKTFGLSNRQHVKITLIEVFSSGLAGAAIAVIVSYLEIRTIFLVAGPKISIVPELDTAVFWSAGGMGILITLAGSVVPVIKSRRMKLVEEIKFE
ncbi:FtsX-like permease family protein [Clostridium sp. MCC353]|nr:FtsX-like permease family protein [Clostridium sp. MCC353]